MTRAGVHPRLALFWCGLALACESWYGTRTVLYRLVACTLVAAVAFLGAGCAKPEPDAVFLIVVDTLRPDRLSCYGETSFETPGVDALANAGVRFDRAQSVASWTLPSMGAMLTSLYPTQLGLVEKPAPPSTPFEWRERREQNSFTIPYEETTLAEILKEAGYRTAAFVDQPGLNATDGFAQGFDDYYYPEDVTTIARFDPDTPLVTKRWPPFLRSALSIDSLLVDRMDAWLEANGDHRVFVWIHLLVPHSPYNAPPWTKQRIVQQPEGRSAESNAYDGEVIASDDLVGRIVRSIDQHVGRDRSVVVFTSDHGEAFGEHAMTGHGHTLHNEVLQVPLIVRAPGVPAGTSTATVVRTIDILPTALELVGIAVTAEMGLEGSSLVSVFAGGEDRPVYSEGMLYGSTERALLGGGAKLMFDALVDDDQLFDAANDPNELNDVATEEPATARRLRRQLDEFYADLAEDYSRRLTPARSSEETERIRDALKSLGYIGGDQ